MAVDAILVYGTRLYYSLDGVSYTEFTDLREVEAPGTPEAPEVDITPLADSSDYRQFRLGLSVAGEFTFRQYYKKSRLTTLISLFRTSIYWRLIYPDNATPANASKVEFVGYVKRWAPPAATNPDDPAVIEGTVKLTGAPTFTEGS